MFSPARSIDELRTDVVKALQAFAEGASAEDVEDLLQLTITLAYQAGQIEANNKHLEKILEQPR